MGAGVGYFIVMTDLERAKLILIQELENMPHTRYDLLGNAACGRKIKNVIKAYILEHFEQSICMSELKSLMIESGVSEESFEKEIIPEIDIFYRAKALLDEGYFNELKNK